MTIHHATVKRAAALGFTLTEKDDVVVGLINDTNIELEADDAKFVIVGLQLAKRFHLEYPAMLVGMEAGNDTGTVFHVSDPDNTLAEFGVDSDLDEVFATALENAQNDELDPTKANPDDPDVEDEEETTGNVVSQRYKDEYRARGNPNNCGDWLATVLEGAFTKTVVDGKKTKAFNFDAFTVCLQLNGVAFTGKWAALPESGQKGWQGRYRMNGRQLLEKRVAASGKLYLFPGEEPLPCPADERERLLAKHPGIEAEVEAEVETEEGGE